MKRLILSTLIFISVSLFLQAQTAEEVVQRHLETYAQMSDLETMSDIAYAGELIVYHNVDRLDKALDNVVEEWGGRAKNATYFEYLSVDTDLGRKAFYLLELKAGNKKELIQAFGFDGNDAWIYDEGKYRTMTEEERQSNLKGPFFSPLLVGAYEKESLSVLIKKHGYIGLSFLDNQGVMHDYELKDYRLLSDTFVDAEGWTVKINFTDYQKVTHWLNVPLEQEILRTPPGGASNGVQRMVFKLKAVSVNEPENWTYVKRPARRQ